MDKRIEDLVEYTRETYDLNKYYLYKWDIQRSVSIFGDTDYILSMEWFPNHVKDWNDETYNPKGTACIDIDIHSKKSKSIIFVGGISYVDNMKFDFENKDEIITWIEKITGLNYKKQFEFLKEEERDLYFKECIDGIAVSPSGYIEFKLDEEGKLIFFSVDGQFPSEELIKKETYKISVNQIEELAREQLKLFEFPNMEQEKLVAVFGIEEIYVRNDGKGHLPYNFFIDEKPRFVVGEVIEWDKKVSKPFHRKVIRMGEETITPEQAFQCEQHPDLKPIKDEEVKKCISEIQNLLSQVYASDSGKWILKYLQRDKGYIKGTIVLKEQKEASIFKRKVILFIDSKTYEVLNYMDSKELLEACTELKETDAIKVTKKKAFKQLKSSFVLKPYYVYDPNQGYYVLCGKLDCKYAVNTHTGLVIELEGL